MQHDVAAAQAHQVGWFVQSPPQSQYCAAGSPGHKTAPGGTATGSDDDGDGCGDGSGEGDGISAGNGDCTVIKMSLAPANVVINEARKASASKAAASPLIVNSTETAGIRLEPGLNGGGGEGGGEGGGGKGGGTGGVEGGGLGGGLGGGGDGAAKARVDTNTETTLSMVTPSSVEKSAADVPLKVAAALSATDALVMMSCALMAMVRPCWLGYGEGDGDGSGPCDKRRTNLWTVSAKAEGDGDG